MKQMKVHFFTVLLFLLVGLYGFSATNEWYNSRFIKIDSLLNEGLPREALSLCDSIFQTAIIEREDIMILRSVILRNQCISAFEEEPLVATLDRLHADLPKLGSPMKQVFHSLIATIYWNYYQQNRWTFHQRTALTEPIGDDVRTWDLNRLATEMIRHLEKSLTDEEKLQETPVDVYAALLEGDSTLRPLRPTLFDLLGHRVLELTENSEMGLVKPVDAFDLNSEAFFSPAREFVEIDLTTSDTLSLRYQSLMIYQRLARFRLGDHNPAALVELEMGRISYLFNNSTHPEKDSLTVRFYEELRQQTLHDETNAEVNYRLALHHFYRQETGKDDRYRICLELCRETLRDFPGTKGAELCEKMIGNIKKPELSVEVEAVEMSDKPFRVFTTWKNLPSAFFTIYRFHSDKEAVFSRQWQFRIENLKDLPVVRTWKLSLPSFSDYLSHKAEIPAEGLPAGFYLLVATDSMNVEKSNLQVACLLQVSDLTAMSRTIPKEKLIVVSHSQNGLPVHKALVELFIRQYNNTTRTWEYATYQQLQTNAAGEAGFQTGKAANYRVQVSYKGDTLLLNDQFFGYYDGEYKENDSRTIVLYTDRSIYRPGQTVQFKGLVLNKKKEKYEIVTGYKETIRLTDVNGQEVGSLKVVSNEYGTFSGSFPLPASGLNGLYHLESPLGVVSFSMEAYRRPTFEVKFDKPDRSFSFGDTVSVTVQVKTFSDTPVDGASVSYSVTRREERLGWWWRPAIPEKMVATGKTSTGNDGRFTISFTDEGRDISDRKRVMVYEISAEATDRNGETQSGRFSVRISESNLLVNCDLPEIVQTGEFKGMKLEATNLNGEIVEAKASITVTRLEAPGHFFVNRYWSEPDTFLISKKDFRKKFPGYPYRNEQDPEHWERGKEVIKQSVGLPSTEALGLSDWMKAGSGYYRVDILVTTPDGKHKALWNRTVRLLTDNPAKAEKTSDWVTVIKNRCEPGEMAEIWLTSLNPQSPVRYELIKDDELLKSEIIIPGNKVYRLLIPVEESYRGNVAAQFTQVAANRRYHQKITIEVPHTDKQLDITFTTFRSMLLPGEKEQWGLTIIDKSGKGQMAEMAATLYDASLDQFVKHHWQNQFLPARWNGTYSWQTDLLNRTGKKTAYSKFTYKSLSWFKSYEYLPLFSDLVQGGHFRTLKSGSMTSRNALMEVSATDNIIPTTRAEASGMSVRIRGTSGMKNEEMAVAYEEDAAFSVIEDDLDVVISTSEPQIGFSEIALRKNFQETAFFYPHLYSDKEGKLEISFTMPDAITRWRMLGFAHTKDFKHGGIEKELVTRRQVSVSAYTPRFLRENDTIDISAKITNLTGDTLRGTALLQWADAVSLNPVTTLLLPGDSLLPFVVGPTGSAVVTWKVTVPADLQAVTCKVLAKAGSHSDGEEKLLPVLTNRQLVTESLPFMVRGGEKKDYLFEKMAGHGSSTLTNYRYTVEYTSNPAWYAIQSLPYLMEYPYDCAEQVFTRFYANAAASALVNSSPRIKAVFDAWKNVDTGTFLSNLQKNEELKSVILEETPWLVNGQSESEAKQRIGLLFDLNRMGNEKEAAMRKLLEMQNPNGGFPWFSGMPDNRYITQYIVKGMGEMEKMNLIDPKWKDDWEAMRARALDYLDARIAEDYRELQKEMVKDSTLAEKYRPGALQLHYLYARSFRPKENIAENAVSAFEYYFRQAKKSWLSYNEFEQGLLALTCQRFGDTAVAGRIVKSLSDRAIRSKEDGMYWRNNRPGFFWYQSPVETQALLIGVFNEVTNDKTAVEEMKIWLLRNKQTTHWKTTKATLAACYALLGQGYNLLEENKPLVVSLGGKPLGEIREIVAEAGTGYVKTTFSGSEIEPRMANLTVENPNRGIAWGAAYWQYFEELDKITQAETDVAIKKQLFLKVTSDSGTRLITVTEEKPVRVGDEVVVRIEIHTSRDMEYVHLKDMRAAGFEPVETLSGYRWQDGLGYYREVKDAAVNIFISYLRKGVYVFEYTLRASHSGKFSNGITTLQCMYAPEFTTHSSGERVSVEAGSE